MLKLSAFNQNKTVYKPNIFGQNALASSRVGTLIEAGNQYFNENKIKEALTSYKEAKALSPNNSEIDKRLGKTYYKLEDYNASAEHYKAYISKNEKDDEAWIDLGVSQRKAGFYGEALKSFRKAKEINPKNDLANREILETENSILAIYAPDKAYKEKQAQATANLREALNLTVNYLSPNFMKDLADVQVLFGETASMGGTPNIAQYENYKKTITVSNTYAYASPQVIAAYLVHESIHAKDKDAFTSIREEQDAYEIATKFWIANSKGVEDPEMDYAAELYKQSPDSLKNRVAEIYQMRDPDISKTSPNHPPIKKFHWGKPDKQAASQNLKTYEIIA